MSDKGFGKGFLPSEVFSQYRTGVNFKSGLGHRGVYEQGKMNERYYVGDQWHGVNCGNDRPLVRHNIIKRIADYKIAVVGSNPLSVNYSADGVPNTLDLKERVQQLRDRMAAGDEEVLAAVEKDGGVPADEEVNIVLSAMSDYFRVTAERVKFEDIKETALRNSYISGTGVVYTWWDERVKTGMYADDARKTAVQGDIRCEVLDIENVYFGDPNLDDIQEQPYIIIAQRQSVEELRREARRFGVPAHEIANIGPDSHTAYQAGQMSGDEPDESRKALVLTKLWKEWDEAGREYKIKAVRVCETAAVRPVWELGIRLYPLARFSWERRRGCAYGESEITYLIPNQIAINRMLTASVWAVMMMGMPIMLVNGDIIADEITNEPGQILRINGDSSDVATAARFLNPPSFSPAFDNNIASLINNTLKQSGANDAALGDVRPDNASAIIAVREAATMPMQTVQNRFFSFIEDIAQIWAEFWVMHYGKRSLKVEDDNGVWYFPFDGDRYQELLITTRIDVGASTLWSESQSIRTLDNLFDRQVIDVLQYLNRLPKGTVPNVTGLIRDIKAANAAAAQPGEGSAMPDMDMPPEGAPEGVPPGGADGGDGGAPDVQALIAMLPPEQQEQFAALPPEQQQAMLASVLG